MPEIYSNLWKAAQLATQSSYFPVMVRAACLHVGVEYSSEILQRVVVQPNVINGISLQADESIDTALMTLMTDPTTGPGVDTVIIAAVEAAVAQDAEPESQPE